MTKEPIESWIHLKPYGYAPGDYFSRCLTCNEVKPDLDKRAWCCRECAEKLHNENK